MYNDAFSVRLRKLRTAKAEKLERRKIPQREVAKELNISPGAYASWESGRTRPDIGLLPKIAEYFGVSIDFLLGHKADVQSHTTDTGLVWSLRRTPETENEEQGIRIWQQLMQGEHPEAVAAALAIHFPNEVDGYIKEVVYSDLISTDYLPQEADLAQQVREAFGLREVVVIPTFKDMPFLIRNFMLGEAARA